jgi:hypothetical protein
MTKRNLPTATASRKQAGRRLEDGTSLDLRFCGRRGSPLNRCTFSLGAHSSHPDGQKIEIVVGWVVEPPYAGEVNAVDFWAHYVNSTCPQGTVSTTCPVYGLDQTLRLQVTTGGESQILSLSPNLSNDVPPTFNGEYTANIEPTVPGIYSFTVLGTIESTAINETFTCGPTTFECVDPASEIQFPQPSSSDPQDLSNAQSQISMLQSQIGQTQAYAQTAFSVAAIGAAVGTVGIVMWTTSIVRSRKQRSKRNRRK